MSVCRNTRYLASAGTGKTHQVVNLYLSLLLGRPYPANDTALPGEPTGAIFNGKERVAPERILMLTFSRNAATEMRNRVTESIEKELAGGTAADEFYYWSLLRRLPAAVISTIHAFAQQLLSRNALRMGLAPRLTVIEGAAAAELLADSIATALRTALTGQDEQLIKDLEMLCDGRKVGGIVDAATATIGLCAAWGIDLAGSDPASLVALPVAPKAEELQVLRKKVEDVEWTKAKALLALSDDLKRSCRQLPPDAEPSAVSAIAQRILAAMGINRKAEAKPVYDEAKATLARLAGYSEQLEATRLLVSFLTVTRDALRISQARKYEQGALDFDDLLFKARDLVRGNAACIPPVDVIIIDEAQDNSRLQNEFIALIQAATGASVVVCGDTKQTIYGWRGADPGGMNTFADTLKLVPVPLTVSYRSQQGILDWVNDIFTRIMGTEDYDTHAELHPCKAAAGTAGPSVELMLPDWEALPKPGDWIEVPGRKESIQKPRYKITRKDLAALAEADPDRWAESAEQAPQALIQEARAIARRIRLLASPQCPADWRPRRIWDRASQSWIKSGSGSTYRYRDVLILLRAGTRQEEFEQALQEEGIPYTTDGKGRGFFTRQETRDISHLLQWLAFPHDDNALVALLRSPMIGLTDSAIATLSATAAGITTGKDRRPRNGRWLEILSGQGLTTARQALRDAGLANDLATLERTVSILEQLHKQTGKIHAVDLVREAVRLTGYDAILAGTFHGVQRLANLRKLLSWIQDAERTDNLDLQALASELANQNTQQEPDAAVLDPEDDSVRINTIHAAKGLSSPVVIIPDLQRLPQADKDWILVAKDEHGAARGLTGMIKASLDGEGDPDKIESTGCAECIEVRKRDREAELKRVFYVACTRPRDLLILSGINPNTREDAVWRGWINSHLEACALNPAMVTLRPFSKVAEVWRSLPRIDTPTCPPLDPARVAALLTQHPRPPAQVTHRLPVTALIRHLNEPQEPNKNHGARLEMAAIEVTPRTEGEQEAASHAYTGTIAHRILESLDYSSGTPLASQITNMPELLTLDDGARQKLRLKLQGAATTIATWLKGVTPERIIRELPFAARFTHAGAELIVDGKVDLVFLKDGIWHIVDYKFSDHDTARLRADYTLQLEIYRNALSAPTAGSSLRTPRFATADKAPASFKLLLLAVRGNGACAEVEITGSDGAALSAALIQGARELQAEGSSKSEELADAGGEDGTAFGGVGAGDGTI